MKEENTVRPVRRRKASRPTPKRIRHYRKPASAVVEVIVQEKVGASVEAVSEVASVLVQIPSLGSLVSPVSDQEEEPTGEELSQEELSHEQIEADFQELLREHGGNTPE